MNIQDILKSTLFQQTAPLIVIILVPALILVATLHLRRLSLDRLFLRWFRRFSMGLESFGLSIPWLWSSDTVAGSNAHGKRHTRKSGGSKSKGSVRTRADQIAMNDLGKKQAQHDDETQYYPGLVNISGTYCFMNSTLQAMASLTYLQPHIDAIRSRAEALDVPTPAIDTLQELFKNLNTPKSRYHSIRPHDIISVLSTPIPGSNRSPLFSSREHQDAQELFQLVSERIKSEMLAVEKEGLKDRGMAGVLELRKSPAAEDDGVRGSANKSVFDGLTANRRSCVMCGYTEAVMHFGFDNWQLPVPLLTSCRLEACLEEYTRLEMLTDCICRKCSVLATHRRLLEEMKSLQEALAPQSSPTPETPFEPGSPLASSSSLPSSTPAKRAKVSNSKKKRYREVKKMEKKVKTALEEGRIEDESFLEGVRLEKVVSPASTKQAMIARPPPVLALHLNRSVHYGQYASKNTIRVQFPEILDLTPYTTSGSLSTNPTNALSTPPPRPSSSIPSQSSSTSAASSSSISTTSGQPRRSTTPTPETYAPGLQRTIYRLAAVVCHYGQHSFGHYICYRRKPRRIGGKWIPPTLVDPLLLENEQEEEDAEKKKPNGGSAHATKTPEYFGSSSFGEGRYYWEDRTEEDVGTGRGWLRISDDAVSEVGIESVLAESSGAFMLYYERAIHPKPGVYLRSRQKKGSEGVARADERRTRSRSRTRSASVYDLDIDGLIDGDGDSFSVDSEETLKPEMKVVDLNGSVGSLISEVGVGVMKVPKKGKDKERAKLDPGRGIEAMSMSAQLPIPSASSSLSSSGVGARIVRSVNARRRTHETPVTMNGVSAHSSPSPAPTSSSPPTPTLVNGSATHDQEQEFDDKILADMTASAPSILSTGITQLPTLNGQQSAMTNAHSSTNNIGIGSKNTRVHHSPPRAGVNIASP